jgi:hypothetical protein
MPNSLCQYFETHICVFLFGFFLLQISFRQQKAVGWHFGKAIDRYLRLAQVTPQIALAHVVLVCEVFAGVLLSGKMFN